jgi:hypothetical protein
MLEQLRMSISRVHITVALEGPPAESRSHPCFPTCRSNLQRTGLGSSYLVKNLERPLSTPESPPSSTSAPRPLVAVWYFNSPSDEPFLSPIQLYSLPRGSLVVRGAVACTLTAANLSRGQLSLFFPLQHCFVRFLGKLDPPTRSCLLNRASCPN